LLCAAIVFPDVSVTTKTIAIAFFLVLTAPVAAHMIGRVAYITGIKLWKGTITDELEGMYDEETHELKSNPDDSSSTDDTTKK